MVPTEEVALTREFPFCGRYGYDTAGDLVVYDGEPDAVLMEEADRYSPEGIERQRRATRVGEVLGELRSTTKQRNALGQMVKPRILSEEEENAILAKRLGVEIPEAD